MLVTAKYWALPVLWVSLISVFSTGGFSSENTSRYFLPFLHWLLPSGTSALIEGLHFLIRKLGHWSEYFILALLVYRAFRQGQSPPWQSGWAGWTLVVVLCLSIADEVHQGFVPNRAGIWSDSALDFFGGGCAVLFLYIWHRSKTNGLGAPVRANP